MKVILYMAMSVNGYIAKPNDATPWSKKEWESYSRFCRKFGNIIIGRRTYDIMKGLKEFKNIGNPFTIVLTRKKLKDNSNFTFVKSAKEAINVLKNEGFDTAIVGGGGKINSLFIKNGLIEEIYLDIAPKVLGKGINLFDKQDFDVDLKLIDVRKISKNDVQLHYKVLK